MIFGPSTENKIGLALVAGVFVAFALLSAFVFPRRWPDFPGERGRGIYILASIVLFVAAMTAVELFAVEEEEAGAHEAPPAETQPGTTGTSAGTTTGTQAGGEGDPAAGAKIFAANPCGGCHTLKAANSTGNVGPNLDKAKPDFAKVVNRVTNGSGAMPSFKDQLSEEDIKNVAAYVVESTRGG